MNEFDDIINLKRPPYRKHQPMPRINRAAQFGAFRALSGHEDAIREEGRLTDVWVEVDGVRCEELNRRMSEAKKIIHTRPEVSVTYFVPDEKKSGGEYTTYTGFLRIVDDTLKVLTFTDGTKIDFSTIFDFKLHEKKDDIFDK